MSLHISHTREMYRHFQALQLRQNTALIDTSERPRSLYFQTVASPLPACIIFFITILVSISWLLLTLAIDFFTTSFVEWIDSFRVDIISAATFNSCHYYIYFTPRPVDDIMREDMSFLRIATVSWMFAFLCISLQPRIAEEIAFHCIRVITYLMWESSLHSL